MMIDRVEEFCYLEYSLDVSLTDTALGSDFRLFCRETDLDQLVFCEGSHQLLSLSDLRTEIT